MFAKRMKKKSVSTKGAKCSPCGPTFGMHDLVAHVEHNGLQRAAEAAHAAAGRFLLLRAPRRDAHRQQTEERRDPEHHHELRGREIERDLADVNRRPARQFRLTRQLRQARILNVMRVRDVRRNDVHALERGGRAVGLRRVGVLLRARRESGRSEGNEEREGERADSHVFRSTGSTSDVTKKYATRLISAGSEGQSQGFGPDESVRRQHHEAQQHPHSPTRQHVRGRRELGDREREELHHQRDDRAHNTACRAAGSGQTSVSSHPMTPTSAKLAPAKIAVERITSTAGA